MKKTVTVLAMVMLVAASAFAQVDKLFGLILFENEGVFIEDEIFSVSFYETGDCMVSFSMDDFSIVDGSEILVGRVYNFDGIWEEEDSLIYFMPLPETMEMDVVYIYVDDVEVPLTAELEASAQEHYAESNEEFAAALAADPPVFSMSDVKVSPDRKSVIADVNGQIVTFTARELE